MEHLVNSGAKVAAAQLEEMSKTCFCSFQFFNTKLADHKVM